MSNLADNRLVKAFAELRRAEKKALLPFLTAGYPDLETTEALLEDFERRGIRICELGVPFSDPIADGPTIQASYTDALGHGISTEGILDMVRRYRGNGGTMALVAMVSYSIVYRHGVENFLDKAASGGFDGVIIPDLPLEEASSMEALASARGIANVMLIAPTSSPQRRQEIARHSRGFIYYISIAGITGERTMLPGETIAAVSELRTHTETPVCVGFGISSPEMVSTVCEAADGAIVGSAIVHRITEAQGRKREELVKRVGEFVGELASPLA
jgi:tryptophan synthase alpha chain